MPHRPADWRNPLHVKSDEQSPVIEREGDDTDNDSETDTDTGLASGDLDEDYRFRE
jgi:hypothetical protein